MSQWFVYMLRCNDNTLYSGVTTDLKRRVIEHNTDNNKGAKYTKPRRPVTLVYSKKCKDRSSAASEEATLRKLNKAEKEKLTKD